MNPSTLAAALAGVLTLLTLALLVAVVQLGRLREACDVALAEALEAKTRTQALLDGTIDAIIIVDPGGTVERINAAAAKLLGYADHELAGRDIAAIIDLAPGPGSFAAQVGLVDGQLRRSFRTDRKARHRDGRDIALDVALGMVNLSSGDHLLMSLRDVSERTRIERITDALVLKVGGELQTPLISLAEVLGLVRAGGAGPLPAGAARLIGIAENSSRRLARLVEDLLEVDRIGFGEREVARHPIDVRHILQQAAVGGEGRPAYS